MKKPLSPLNKRHFTGPLWVAADIHLGPHAPNTAAAFYAFLKHAAQHTDALILCGDIFEAWIGDDLIQAPPQWLSDAIDAMRAFTRSAALYLMRGNRDFLLSEHFAYHVGAQLLPDELIICTPNCHFLLAHGDQLCTDDHAYQRFRRLVHNRWIQRLYLSLPLSFRHNIATTLRQQSKQRNYSMLGDIYEPDAALLLHRTQQNLLIHGHTHQPALRSFTAQPELMRVIIPDWEYDHSHPPRGGWVSIDPKGTIGLHQAEQPSQYLQCPASGGSTVF